MEPTKALNRNKWYFEEKKNLLVGFALTDIICTSKTTLNLQTNETAYSLPGTWSKQIYLEKYKILRHAVCIVTHNFFFFFKFDFKSGNALSRSISCNMVFVCYARVITVQVLHILCTRASNMSI